MVTAEGLKVSLLVADTVPGEDMVGEEGLGPQAHGNKTNNPKAQPNQSENILFTTPPQKNKLKKKLSILQAGSVCKGGGFFIYILSKR